jgi:hypothetical protein
MVKYMVYTLLYLKSTCLLILNSAIPPNYDLQYEFNITQNGTYWIHSHYMVSTLIIKLF